MEQAGNGAKGGGGGSSGSGGRYPGRIGEGIPEAE
jgi:hypothetical protein